MRKGLAALLERLPEAEVTAEFQTWLRGSMDEWTQLDRRIQAGEAQIRWTYRNTPACSQLGEVEALAR